MRELHLLRTGKLLFLTQIVTTIFLTIGLLSQMMLSGMPPIRSIVPLVVNIGVFVASIFVYLKFKGSYKYFYFVGIAFSVLYLFIMLLGASGSVFPYMIPYLIVLVLALDKKIVNIVGAVFLVVNMMRVGMTFATAADPQTAIESCMIEIIITILVALVSMKGVTLVNQFFTESAAELTSASEKNSAMTEKIIEVARNVEEETECAKENIAQISEQTQNLSSSMNDISSGITGVAEAILSQTIETQEIQNIITSFQNANSPIAQTMDFILSYIDKNITLCQTAFESLGEQELKNMYERDLKVFLAHTIDYICNSKNLTISEDFRNFLIYNFTSMLSNQIAWYIKYYNDLDKTKFYDYLQTSLFSSLEGTIVEANKKKL